MVMSLGSVRGRTPARQRRLLASPASQSL